MQNMMMTIFVLIGLFFLFIGFKEFRKTTGKEDYFLAGRNVGFFTLTLTFLATQLGGGVIIGCFEAAKTRGLQAGFYAFGLGLGLCLLSLGFSQKFRRLEITTIPEIFEKVYKRLLLRRITGLIMAFVYFLILGALAISLRKMTGSMLEQGDFIFIFFWAVLVFYAGLGGFAAVIKTDKYQVMAILIIFVIIGFFIQDDLMTTVSQLKAPKAIFTGLSWFEWIFMPLGFALIGQDMGQRCFAAKTPKIAALSALAAGIILMISAIIPVTLGMIGVDHPDQGIIEVILSQTNSFMALIFGLAIIFAIVSTADSMLSALMCNLGEDLNVKISGKRLFDNINKLRIIVLFIGFCAGSFAFLELNIIPLMIIAYELTLVVMLVPILAALILSNPKPASATRAVSSGLLCYIAHYLGYFNDGFLPWQVYSFGISGVAYMLGNLQKA